MLEINFANLKNEKQFIDVHVNFMDFLQKLLETELKHKFKFEEIVIIGIVTLLSSFSSRHSALTIYSFLSSLMNETLNGELNIENIISQTFMSNQIEAMWSLNKDITDINFREVN